MAIILLFSGCNLLINSLLPNQYEVLERNWGINLPKADEVTDLLTTETSFHGHGEWFTFFDYSKQIDFSNTDFTKLTSSDICDANNKIAQFEKKQLIFIKNPKILLIFLINIILKQKLATIITTMVAMVEMISIFYYSKSKVNNNINMYGINKESISILQNLAPVVSIIVKT